MTVSCESCQGPEDARRGSFSGCPRPADGIGAKVCRRFRSTKGASKARRDHINGEIRNMRALLPISREDQERLSYLHSMSVICTYIRKSILLPVPPQTGHSTTSLPGEDFLQALPGFIVVMTEEGKLVYLSKNVSDYLGLSVVDVLQGDHFYDMIESSYVDVVRQILHAGSNSLEETSFVCEMHTSKAFRLQHGGVCSMLVRGHFQAGPACPLFVALCTPTVNRLRDEERPCFLPNFQTLHQPDMTFTHVSDSVLLYLGRSAEELTGRSWYHLLHPGDLAPAAHGHRTLMEANEDTHVEMVLRVQRKDFSWTWLYTSAARNSQNDIDCTNFIISETEALFLRQKNNRVPPATIHSPQTSQAPLSPDGVTSKHSKRQRDPSCPDEQPRRKTRLSESSVQNPGFGSSSSIDGGQGSHLYCTPPYSPAESPCPILQGEGSSDLLLEVYRSTERLVSPQGASPLYVPSSRRVEPQLPAPFIHNEVLYTHTLEPRTYSVSSSPSPASPCPLDCIFPGCQGDSCLVPEYQPPSEVSECVLHPEDISLMTMPPLPLGIPNSVQTLQVPENSGFPPQADPLTPTPSPTADFHFHYSQTEREQVEISVLAQQISSLASSFHTYYTPSPAAVPTRVQRHDPGLVWPQQPPTSHSHRTELVLDEGVIDSILKDLDTVLSGRAAPSSGWEEEEAVLTQSHAQDPSLGTMADYLRLGRFPSADAGLGTVCRLQSTGLHQLSHEPL
ncbi:neuronal PAS domain-containing protein 4-like [Denticeps clupeoides]|uniref:neuronal PAS domain-containing protein 4-like n=1 Tax=Denticeps clupeoides TaxID=299321 RepID=UPI0010A4B00E|nr:neuronal PAS domain-containing protein 4-like [Denticeps clupeoides]